MNHPIPVLLSEAERASLQTFIYADKAAARVFTRARVLLKAVEGWSDAHICEVFDIRRTPSIRVRRSSLEGGWEAVLHDIQHARDRKAVTGSQGAIACTPAPHDHWTVRFLAGKAVERGFVESISPETIRHLLKKMNAHPGNTKHGASPMEERNVLR